MQPMKINYKKWVQQFHTHTPPTITLGVYKHQKITTSNTIKTEPTSYTPLYHHLVVKKRNATQPTNSTIIYNGVQTEAVKSFKRSECIDLFCVDFNWNRMVCSARRESRRRMDYLVVTTILYKGRVIYAVSGGNNTVLDNGCVINRIEPKSSYKIEDDVELKGKKTGSRLEFKSNFKIVDENKVELSLISKTLINADENKVEPPFNSKTLINADENKVEPPFNSKTLINADENKVELSLISKTINKVESLSNSKTANRVELLFTESIKNPKNLVFSLKKDNLKLKNVVYLDIKRRRTLGDLEVFKKQEEEMHKKIHEFVEQIDMVSLYVNTPILNLLSFGRSIVCIDNKTIEEQKTEFRFVDCLYYKKDEIDYALDILIYNEHRFNSYSDVKNEHLVYSRSVPGHYSPVVCIEFTNLSVLAAIESNPTTEYLRAVRRIAIRLSVENSQAAQLLLTRLSLHLKSAQPLAEPLSLKVETLVSKIESYGCRVAAALSDYFVVETCDMSLLAAQLRIDFPLLAIRVVRRIERMLLVDCNCYLYYEQGKSGCVCEDRLPVEFVDAVMKNFMKGGCEKKDLSMRKSENSFSNEGLIIKNNIVDKLFIKNNENSDLLVKKSETTNNEDLSINNNTADENNKKEDYAVIDREELMEIELTNRGEKRTRTPTIANKQFLKPSYFYEIIMKRLLPVETILKMLSILRLTGYDSLVKECYTLLNRFERNIEHIKIPIICGCGALNLYFLGIENRCFVCLKKYDVEIEENVLIGFCRNVKPEEWVVLKKACRTDRTREFIKQYKCIFE